MDTVIANQDEQTHLLKQLLQAVAPSIHLDANKKGEIGVTTSEGLNQSLSKATAVSMDVVPSAAPSTDVVQAVSTDAEDTTAKRICTLPLSQQTLPRTDVHLNRIEVSHLTMPCGFKGGDNFSQETKPSLNPQDEVMIRGTKGKERLKVYDLPRPDILGNESIKLMGKVFDMNKRMAIGKPHLAQIFRDGV